MKIALRSLDYQEEAAETCGAQSWGWSHRKTKEIFHLCHPKPWSREAQCQEGPLSDSPSMGKKVSSVTHLGYLLPLPWGPQSSPVLTLADRTCPAFQVLNVFPKDEAVTETRLVSRLPSFCCAPQSGIRMRSGALPELLMLCTLVSGPKSQLWPISTGAELLLLPSWACILSGGFSPP